MHTDADAHRHTGVDTRTHTHAHTHTHTHTHIHTYMYVYKHKIYSCVCTLYIPFSFLYSLTIYLPKTTLNTIFSEWINKIKNKLARVWRSRERRSGRKTERGQGRGRGRAGPFEFVPWLREGVPCFIPLCLVGRAVHIIFEKIKASPETCILDPIAGSRTW